MATQVPKSQEFSVHVSREGRKKFHLLKFASGTDIDFVKLKDKALKLDRENNLKDFKSAYDIDVAPKFGAGSVFGREEKEEARRRKYGIMRKKYDTEKQPWVLRVGTGKEAKKYKGVREGTVSDNTSYFIFSQKPDGKFEAYPVNEWYAFSQIIKYKYLNSDEAEDEFNKRDKTLNYFNIMLKRRLRNEEDTKGGEKDESEKVQKSKGKKDKDFLLTEMDEWAIMSDDEGNLDMDDDDDKKKDDSDDDKSKKRKGKKGEVKKRRKNAKQNSDDEAIEESDEGDFDDREVDYMTGSESSLSDIEEKVKAEDDKGVDEEHGLRKLIDSGDESEEENKDEENEEEKEDDKDKAAKKDKGSGSDSSSSDSSDSDLEKDVTSAIFIQKKNLAKKEKQRSRSTTPQNTPDTVIDKKASNLKRKQEPADTITSKKPRTNSPLLASGPPGEGITEESVRRYLIRKPMTAKDLLQKFKSKKMNLSGEHMATTIAQILKKIQPDSRFVNKTMYFSLKTPDTAV